MDAQDSMDAENKAQSELSQEIARVHAALEQAIDDVSRETRSYESALSESIAALGEIVESADRELMKIEDEVAGETETIEKTEE